MTITIQKLKPAGLNQFSELLDVFEEAFDRVSFNRPPQSYWQELLQRDTVWVFAALVDEQVAGGLIAYVLPTYSSQRPTVYLYDLAVRSSCQRRGIGRQLLTTLTQHARSVGCSDVFVQTDADDAEAIAFYQATGGQAQGVVHFTYPLTP